MLHQDMDNSQIEGKQVLEYLQIIIDFFKSTQSTDYIDYFNMCTDNLEH